MDDKKKLAALVGVIVVAIAAIGFMFSKGTGGEAAPRSVGTLEGNVNHENGLPLNPPRQGEGADQPANDPSLPSGR